MSRTPMVAVKLKAVFVPEDGGWCVSIPSVPGCRSEGRSLAEARRNIREALATCVDVYPRAGVVARTAEIEEDIRLPGGARQVLAKARRAREAAAKSQADAQRKSTEAARALRAADVGLSLRDVGELLGVSHQRVKQLAAR